MTKGKITTIWDVEQAFPVGQYLPPGPERDALLASLSDVCETAPEYVCRCGYTPLTHPEHFPSPRERRRTWFVMVDEGVNNITHEIDGWIVAKFAKRTTDAETQ